jgi:predicted NUDIX family NTP pyrophosphohydrolase
VLSAGILMYRRIGPKLEVLLVHPGGPYWRRKDDGILEGQRPLLDRLEKLPTTN